MQKKAGAYEKSFDPNKEWNLKLDADVQRHRSLRSKKTAELSKLRKEKVKKYQKIKRLKLTSEQKNQIRFAKWEDQRMRRKDEKVENSEKWTDIFRHNNLKELKESGSYFYFLHDLQCFSQPRVERDIGCAWELSSDRSPWISGLSHAEVF